MSRKNFCIISDGSCDLPNSITKEKEVDVVHFPVSFDGKEYKKEGVEIALDEFYQRMVDEPKTYPMTAAPSPQDFYECFEKHAKKGTDILCICISTKLSSSLQSAGIAKEMLAETYPHIRVELLDSLSCTLMQGAYVLEVCRLRDAGRTLDETISVMKQLISSGRKSSLVGVIDLLISYLQENSCTPDDCTILIGYCHDKKEAETFQKMTSERLGKIFGTTASLPLCQIGATIGVHAGPYSIRYGIIRRSDRL